MKRSDRRSFLQSGAALAAVAGMAKWGLSAEGRKLSQGAPTAEKLGWRLGCQAYSFNQFTFFEALDKTASLGLRCIEMYPGQKLSKEKPQVTVGHGMSSEARAEVKKKLKATGIKLVCYGVVGLSKDKAASRQVFEFAKEMGIEVIVSEPPENAFDTIEKLADEFGISVALHNHPKPSPYWDPDAVLKACRGRSKRIGACADTGHWMRSGVNPVKALQKLEGRIVSFHFKDLNQYGAGHDVPWGTGKGDVKAILAEIHRQGIKAPFSIEYEHNWLNSLPEIAQCVDYFEKVARELQ
jgi:sugar phosphate isomerase/epimerase